MPKGIYQRSKKSRSASNVAVLERQPKPNGRPTVEFIDTLMPPPDGYISEDTYLELQQRYRFLEMELAERDLSIAHLQVECAEHRRAILKRLYNEKQG